MRLLNYLQNSIIPSIHQIGLVYNDKLETNNELVKDVELIKAINDLIYLKEEYNDRLKNILPYIVEKNGKLRSTIKKELQK